MVVIFFKVRFLKILWKNTWLQRLLIGKVVNMEGDEVYLNNSSVSSGLFQLVKTFSLLEKSKFFNQNITKIHQQIVQVIKNPEFFFKKENCSDLYPTSISSQLFRFCISPDISETFIIFPNVYMTPDSRRFHSKNSFCVWFGCFFFFFLVGGINLR